MGLSTSKITMRTAFPSWLTGISESFKAFLSMIYFDFRTTKTPLSFTSDAVLKQAVERPTWLLNHDAITLMMKLGEGAFGEVGRFVKLITILRITCDFCFAFRLSLFSRSPLILFRYYALVFMVVWAYLFKYSSRWYIFYYLFIFFYCYQ